MIRPVKPIRYYLPQIPGWRTRRKIVVIESDDWGSIRMPSRETYEALMKKGYHVNRDPYMKYDALASEEDLAALFEVLSSVKDMQGNPAGLTANCLVSNPDFPKIREAGFASYHYEVFTETLKRYPAHARSFDLWREGMAAGLFRPQYHGREHVNVSRWMDALREGDPTVRLAFDMQMLSISSEPVEKPVTYMESMEFMNDRQRDEIGESLADGMRLFREVFGWTPTSFIGTCYTWSKQHEQLLHQQGIRAIQGIPFQRQPVVRDKGFCYRHTFHYTGQKNLNDQVYLVRNAFFEPSLDPVNLDKENCLKRMGVAFDMHKPVIIGSHRLNYIGHVDRQNRENNLRGLKALLEEMVRRWPDIEFMSSDQLGDLILGKQA